MPGAFAQARVCVCVMTYSFICRLGRPIGRPGSRKIETKNLKSAEFSESTNTHEAHAAHMICTTVEFSRYEPKRKYDGGHGVSDKAIRKPYVVTTWTHAVQLVPLNFLE